MDDPYQKDLYDFAASCQRQGLKVALATVVETWGSAPRPVGSQMIVDEKGTIMGSVSGGCVESAVIAEAQNFFKTRTPKLLTFKVSDGQAWQVGLACGGTIVVFVQELDANLLAAISTERRDRQRFAVLTDLRTAAWMIVTTSSPSLADDTHEAMRLAPLAEAQKYLAADKDGILHDRDHQWFVRIDRPRRRLFIVGAVHIAQSLAPMAAICGYDVTIIDPREQFAAPTRFPDMRLKTAWPDEALAKSELDSQSAVVVLTHDPKLDDPALIEALKSPAFFIGALGSRKTQDARLDRLRLLGIDQADLQRIRGPVGLPIGALSASEIAVSILAEMTQTLRKGQLRDFR